MMKTLLLNAAFLFMGSHLQQGDTMVYISTGPYAKSYHCRLNCHTIKRCVEEGHYKKSHSRRHSAWAASPAGCAISRIEE